MPVDLVGMKRTGPRGVIYSRHVRVGAAADIDT